MLKLVAVFIFALATSTARADNHTTNSNQFIEEYKKCTRPPCTDSEEGRLVALYSYKPIYILAGDPYSKIQFSFQTQILADLPVYFAYTQLMLWDFFIPSAYMYDVNYDPLAWYRLNFNTRNKQWLDLIPFEHESNGKGGDGERSWDRTAVSYHLTSTVADDVKFYTEFKVWVPLRYNKNNNDLAQYRGVWELNLAISQLATPHFPANDLTLRIYPGGKSLTDPTHGGQELTLRVRSSSGKFLPYGVFQVFHGYGEFLQDYNLDRWGLRAGIGF
jgi:outer membrane phospholipase A